MTKTIKRKYTNLNDNNFLSRSAFRPGVKKEIMRKYSMNYKRYNKDGSDWYAKPYTLYAATKAKQINNLINKYRNKFPQEEKEYLESIFKLKYPNSFGTKIQVLSDNDLSRVAFHPDRYNIIQKTSEKKHPGQFQRPRTKKAHYVSKLITEDIKEYRNKFPEKEYIESIFKLKYPIRFGSRKSRKSRKNRRN